MRTSKRLRPRHAGRGPSIEERDGIAVIHLGEANVWDFGDLTRIREAATEVFQRGGTRVGINLANVGVLPSGFVHMLCGWQDRGREVFLFEPRPNVREMLWFRQFTEPAAGGAWRMTCSPPEDVWPEYNRSSGRLPDAGQPSPACDPEAVAAGGST